MFPYPYRFLEPYYLLQYTILLSYFFVRRPYVGTASFLTPSGPSWFGLSREVEIFLLVLVIQLKNIKKGFTVDRFVDSFLLSMKSVILVVTFQLNHSICFVYCILFLFHYCTLSPPTFHGETKVIDYGEMSFKSLVLQDITNTKYIVMFDTRWATRIEYVKALFASLSVKYTTESTIFLHVDVTNSISFANEMRIDISGYAGEIPVFICFQKGKEIARVPQIQSKPRMTPYRWTQEILSTAFSLHD